MDTHEQGCSIFISHAAVDEEIARSIKQHLEDAFPDQTVFVSSDPEDLKPGDDWISKILEGLESARCVLALVTERGLKRKWVWFEAGRTWFSGVKLVPCCLGKIRKDNLPAPFSGLMAVNIDELQDANYLFSVLKEVCGTNPTSVDFKTFVETMIRLDVRAEEKNKILEDPFAQEIMTEIGLTMESLSPPERETIRQFVIHGELSTGAARNLAQRSKLGMERWSVPEHLVRVTGWLVPRPGNTPYDNMEQNVYSVNPQVRMFLQAYFLTHK